MSSKFILTIVFCAGLTCGISAQTLKLHTDVNRHTVVLCSDSTLKAFGENERGALGTGTKVDEYYPVTVPGIDQVIEAECGVWHTVALKNDGTVWCWGDNTYGQLGDGTDTSRFSPVPVAGLEDATAVATCGYHSLALKKDSSVWAWGLNTYGQLGDSTTNNSPTPVRVKGLKSIIAIRGGIYHSLALDKDGNVWAWGYNYYGQLGDGTNKERHVPVLMEGPEHIVDFAAGVKNTFLLDTTGNVWGCGQNQFGQLCDDTFIDRYTPVQVNGIKDVVNIATGDVHSVALKEDGTVWAWGWNYYGQVGDSTQENKTSPVQINVDSVINVRSIGFKSMAVTTTREVWMWGDNESGQLGTGVNQDTAFYPVQTSLSCFPLCTAPPDFYYKQDSNKVSPVPYARSNTLYNRGQLSWSVNDSLVNPGKINFQESGTYQICLLTTTNCHEDSSCIELVIEDASTVNVDHASISIAPNPAYQTASLTLNIPERSLVTALIYDASGRIVQPLLSSLTRFEPGIYTFDTINISALNAGLYFIFVSINGTPYTQKLIISD